MSIGKLFLEQSCQLTQKFGQNLNRRTKFITMIKHLLLGKDRQAKIKTAADLLGISVAELEEMFYADPDIPKITSRREAAAVLGFSKSQVAILEQIKEQGIRAWCLKKLGLEAEDVEVVRAFKTRNGEQVNHHSFGGFLKTVYKEYRSIKEDNGGAWKYQPENIHVIEIAETLVKLSSSLLALEKEEAGETEEFKKSRHALYLQMVIQAYYANHLLFFGVKVPPTTEPPIEVTEKETN